MADFRGEVEDDLFGDAGDADPALLRSLFGDPEESGSEGDDDVGRLLIDAGAAASVAVEDLPEDLFGEADYEIGERRPVPEEEKGAGKKRKRDRKDDAAEASASPSASSSVSSASSSSMRSKGNVMAAALDRIRQRKKSRTPVELPEEQAHEAAEKLIRRMQEAHQADEEAAAASQPAVSKLTALPEVVQMIRHAALREMLAQDDRLFACMRDWLAPMAGSLPNLKIRTEFLNLLSLYFPTVDPDTLRKSGIGGVVNFLAKCQAEEPQNRVTARKIVEGWARPAEERDYRRVTEEIQIRSEETGLSSRQREAMRLKSDRDAVRAAGLASRKVVSGAKDEDSSVRGSGFRARIPETTQMNFSRLPVSEFDTEELKKRGATKNAGNPRLAKALNQLKGQRSSRQ